MILANPGSSSRVSVCINAKIKQTMKTIVSLSRSFGSFSLSQSALLSLAVSAAVMFFTAMILQFEFFAYLCAVVAFAAVYSLDKKGGRK